MSGRPDETYCLGTLSLARLDPDWPITLPTGKVKVGHPYDYIVTAKGMPLVSYNLPYKYSRIMVSDMEIPEPELTVIFGSS